jgi:hypothetical protein
MGLCIWVTFFKIKECGQNYYGCKNELQGTCSLSSKYPKMEEPIMDKISNSAHENIVIVMFAIRNKREHKIEKYKNRNICEDNEFSKVSH